MTIFNGIKEQEFFIEQYMDGHRSVIEWTLFRNGAESTGIFSLDMKWLVLV